MPGGILGLAWKRYLQQLDQKPLKTKVGASGSSGRRCGLSHTVLFVAEARPPFSVCSLPRPRTHPPLPNLQAITAGVLAGVSDLLAQRLSSRGTPANWRRTLSIALYGFLWAGPASHYWQQALERLFPNRKDPMRRCGTLRNFTRQGLSSPAICKQPSGHAAPAHSPQHSTPPCCLSLQPQKGAG